MRDFEQSCISAGHTLACNYGPTFYILYFYVSGRRSNRVKSKHIWNGPGLLYLLCRRLSPFMCVIYRKSHPCCSILTRPEFPTLFTPVHDAHLGRLHLRLRRGRTQVHSFRVKSRQPEPDAAALRDTTNGTGVGLPISWGG